MGKESDLKIRGVGFPALSCRGAVQTLTPINHGELKRSINGELSYVGAPNHQKYKSSIICSDKNIPGLQQLWVGALVIVECLSELWEQIVIEEENKDPLSRKSVEGSIKIFSQKGEALGFIQKDDVLRVPGEEGKTAMISYRPILKMRITSFSFKKSEWDDDSCWQLDLEEV